MSESPQAGSAPRPADPGLDETAYATRIEDAFIAERGTPFLVSAKDWGLIRGWRDAGVPADTVVRAVREAFERRRARGQAGKISSLAYCADAVSERWEMERRGLVGREDAPPAAAADAAATGEKLAALAAALRAAEEKKKKFLLRKENEGDPGATNDGEASGSALELLRRGNEKAGARSGVGAPAGTGPFEASSGALRTALDAAATKVEAISSDLPFEEIEHKLSSVEASLVRAGLKAMNSSSLAFVEARVSEALGDVSGLAPHVVERMRRALTRREVRALAGFPPLTLLHG
jgi:hypothetical protein